MNSANPTRGFPYYARIAGFLLRDGPKTSIEIMNWGGGHAASTTAIMAQLWARKAIHIHAWIKNAAGNANVAVWAWGSAPDAPVPPTNRGKPGRLPKMQTREPRSEMPAFVEFMRVIAEPSTYATIAEETGLERRTIKRGLDTLRSMGVARIAGWDITGKNPCAMFQLGTGPDKPKPAPVRSKRSYMQTRNRKVGARDRMLMIIRALANVNQPEKETA